MIGMYVFIGPAVIVLGLITNAIAERIGDRRDMARRMLSEQEVTGPKPVLFGPLPDKMSPDAQRALKLWGREQRVKKALMLSDDPEAVVAETMEIIGRIESFALSDQASPTQIADKILNRN